MSNKNEYQVLFKNLQLIGNLSNIEFKKMEGGPINHCFVIAYVLKKSFENIGIYGRVVHGSLFLVSEDGRLMYYGDHKELEDHENFICIGTYHEWFEFSYSKSNIIFDPCLRHIKDYWGLRKINPHPQILNVLVTQTRKANLFHYIEMEGGKNSSELLGLASEYEKCLGFNPSEYLKHVNSFSQDVPNYPDYKLDSLIGYVTQLLEKYYKNGIKYS